MPKLLPRLVTKIKNDGFLISEGSIARLGPGRFRAVVSGTQISHSVFFFAQAHCLALRRMLNIFYLQALGQQFHNHNFKMDNNESGRTEDEIV